jgi:hypothetical protein
VTKLCRKVCSDPSCPVCRVYQRMGVPAGTKIHFHGNTTIATTRTAPARKPPARRPLPCVYLGKVLRRAGCGTCRRDDVRQCEAGHGEVSQNGRCDAVNPDGSFVCGDYEADRIPGA